MNLLCGSVCLLIPIIGQIVLIGYLGEVVEILHRRGSDHRPEFDFNRLVEYMIRGVWVFLVTLVISLIFMPVILVVIGIPLLAIPIFELEEAGVLLAILVAVAGGMVVSLLLNVVLIPFYLRAALLQEFAGAFALGFIIDFAKRTWFELMLVTLFIVVTAIPLALVGYALCFVGVYPAMVLLMIAQWHLMYQLYELYLQRGGMEIPLKDPPPPAAVLTG